MTSAIKYAWIFTAMLSISVVHAEESGAPVAQVGPLSISQDELNKEVMVQLAQYQNDTALYEKKRSFLEQKTRDMLFSLAAKDAKTSVEAWKKKEIDQQVKAPTQAEIDAEIARITQIQSQRGQPVTDPQFQAEVKKQVNDNLPLQKKSLREQEVLASLQQKYPVKILLAPPAVPNIQIPTRADDFVKGPASAKVTIVEYTDIQCPYCARSQSVLHEVLAAYPNDVKIVPKHYPLSFHSRAKPAAEATFCAKEQGKFWEYREKAFAMNTKLEDTDLVQYAKDLGLNEKKFKACYDKHKYAARVEQDIKDGQALGVQGTPHFFVGAKVINGAQPFPAFKAAIDAQLAAK